METLIGSLTDTINAYISVSYLLTFIFLAYGLRGLITDLISIIPIIKKPRTIAVFLIAAALSPIWAFVFHEDLMKIIVTYSVGTSLYELIIQAVITRLKTTSAPPFPKEEA